MPVTNGIFSSGGLPEYHDELLLVKMRPAAATFASAEAFGLGLASGRAPGLSALATFERAGFIKSVTPLGGGALPPLRTFVATMAASVSEAANEGNEGSESLEGVSMIELEKGIDHENVRLALAADPYVESVDRVPVRYLMGRGVPAARRAAVAADAPAAPVVVAAAPPNANTMWNLRKIKWQDALNAGLSAAENISVAVLDTGVDLGHPDLPGNSIKFVHSFLNGPNTSDRDIVGHGTHVSGTIRAIQNNNLGINGICKCNLSVYKIFGDDAVLIPFPFAEFAYVVDPLLYRRSLDACLNAGVQVINLSIGGGGRPDRVERDLFRELIDNNVAVVAAMGNENSSRVSYPAGIRDVIAVGATDLNDDRANFSNFGNHIALSAPGVAIWSTLPTYAGQTGFFPAPNSNPISIGQPQSRETDYAAWQGTSMATPHVAAASAMALAKYPGLTPRDLKQKLMAAVDKVPSMNGSDFTTQFGAGRLNLAKL